MGKKDVKEIKTLICQGAMMLFGWGLMQRPDLIDSPTAVDYIGGLIGLLCFVLNSIPVIWSGLKNG